MRAAPPYKLKPLQKFQNILGATVLALLTPIVINSCYESYKTGKTIEHVNEVIAGEDRVIDHEEAYSFLKAIQFPNLDQDNPIRNESDRLYFRKDHLNPIYGTINIDVGTEPFKTVFSDSKCIGIVHRDKLESLVKELYE